MTTFQKWIILILLIIAISITYYFLVFIPKKEKRKELIRQENFQKLQICLKNAKSDTQTYIDMYCSQNPENCLIPVDSIVNFQRESEKACRETYPQ